MKTSDLCNTPNWLMRHFVNHFDSCPQNPQFDGLSCKWVSPAFVNPPYSDPLPWVEKAISESLGGIDVVLLLKVDPSTKWYRKLVEAHAHFAYFNERLRFIHQLDGEFKSSNNFCNMLVFLEGKR